MNSHADIRAAIAAEASSWLKTPYHHLGDVKGAGVDCAMLLVRVFATLGLVPAELDPRPYTPDWHLHRSEERYLGWLEQYAELQLDGQPEVGDVVAWRYGRTYSHAAIVMGTGPQAPIIHALRQARAVVWGQLDEAELMARPALRYRLHALIERQEEPAA